MKTLLLVTCAVSFLVMAACSDDETAAPEVDPHATTSEDCTEVREACHPLDTGEGPIHDCHEVAHGGDAAKCTERKAECLQICVAGDAGDADASSGHAEADAAADHDHDDAGHEASDDAGDDHDHDADASSEHS